MDNRPSLVATPRPQPLQRALSGGSHTLHQGFKRPAVPSRLSNVRSVSQPVGLLDDGVSFAVVDNSAAFPGSQDHVYTSPDAIIAEEEDDGRPTKRAKVVGREFRATEAVNGTAEAEEDTAYQVVPGSPLPQIRNASRSAIMPAGQNGLQRSGEPVAEMLARQAQGLEPPRMATGLPAPRSVADFSPWHNHHLEDVVSETVIKAGYFDKAPGPNSTESISAKPMVWPNLSQKNNMGLQTLSYLFTSVMEKRQVMGKCTALSSFKPPPRVTVTDTKREAWLRDLANPDIPLRKQSRTIPHGIRGKILLDQCLSKDIPTHRAVWLAQCVGANELRAFQRKSISVTAAAIGEQKWMREWTIHLEQFLEGMIACCGQPGWKRKMGYALRLAASFYSEELLERDHFLDWIAASFALAKIDRLPIWINLVQLYRNDIITFGRRGRQLAVALVDNLHQITTGNVSANTRITKRLKRLVLALVIYNRGCLIIPKIWNKYKYLLAPKTPLVAGGAIDPATVDISKRNARLVGPLLKTAQNTRCALLELYLILDNLGLVFDIEKLAKVCWARVPNRQELVRALLDWAASVYRTGVGRIYLAARLIARLSKSGHDTDSEILDYLKTRNSPALLSENIHRVVAELVRYQSFSTADYLQWLMTSGALSSDRRSTLSVGLLPMLPKAALPARLVATRRMLMKRLDYPPDEDFLLERLTALMNLDAQLNRDTPRRLVEDVEAFSRPSKLELGRQISLYASIWGSEQKITLDLFCKLRDLLMPLDDVLALADVIRAAVGTDDIVLLATACDTVNKHAKSFAATGQFHSLVELVLGSYKRMRQQVLDRSYTFAVTALVKRRGDKGGLLQVLENDLSVCEQQTSMAVCSPASDNLVSMRASDLNSDGDIDAVFASGNTMDEQLMTRVFMRIVQRAERTSSVETRAPSKVCGWLIQLRAVDKTAFDQTMKRYLQDVVNDGEKCSDTSRGLCALVASNCVSLATVVEVASQTKSPAAAATTMRLLTSVKPSLIHLHPAEAFRFSTYQEQYLDENAMKVMPIFASALEYADFNTTDLGLVDFVLKQTTRDHGKGLRTILAASQTPACVTNRKKLVTRLLSLSHPLMTSNANLDIGSIVQSADPLSVVYCACALELQSSAESSGGDVMSQDAVLKALGQGSDVWPQLLGSAGQATINRIYRWAKQKLMHEMFQPGQSIHFRGAEIKHYLDILDVAYHAAPKQADVGTIIIAVVEKLNVVENQLSAATGPKNVNADVLCHLHILLHLSVLYSTSGSDLESHTQSRTKLLRTLCTLFIHPKLQGKESVLDYIYDVASTIADTLPAEVVRALGVTASPQLANDPRLTSVLGTEPSPHRRLGLVSRIQPQGSQQHRVLLKQSRPVQPQLQPRPQPQSHSLQKAPIRPYAAQATKTTPFQVRNWEMMGDATPVMGENDTSLSLGLFRARRGQ